MSDKPELETRPGLMRRIWRGLWSPAAVLSIGVLMFGGFFAGITFWGSFHWALEATNTEKFCVGCHEMQANVYQEYQGTVHQTNSSGVRATCPDCHVPKDWAPKMVRKVQASWELYGHFVTGVIDTPEKFEEHRSDMASNVWKTMLRTDSRECRNCHAFEYMDFTEQENRAADNHQVGFDVGKTCIDCHQGIAHKLPENYLDTFNDVLGTMAANGELPKERLKKMAEQNSGELRNYLAAE